VARPAADSLEFFFKAFPALLGRAATPTERNTFGRYANLLVLWNRTHHLTSLRTRADIGRGLFLDSLLFTPVLPCSPVRVLDIGAGAGIPGVPLRVVDPGLSLSLIESRRKPVSFLHALLRELALPDIAVYHGRAETIVSEVPELQNKFDIVLARAVGLGALLVETALAYLRVGGRLIAAGPPAGTALPALGGAGSAEWKTIEFPKLGIARTFLIVTNGN
jgi:16S rRNA (guanine527-N7)-methyltransferase